MYSASRGILYTPPPPADDGAENRTADETGTESPAETADGSETPADGPSSGDLEETVSPPADD